MDNFLAHNMALWYDISMTKNKDTSIRVFREDYKSLKKLADKEGCSVKYMFSVVMQNFFIDESEKNEAN